MLEKKRSFSLVFPRFLHVFLKEPFWRTCSVLSFKLTPNGSRKVSWKIGCASCLREGPTTNHSKPVDASFILLHFLDRESRENKGALKTKPTQSSWWLNQPIWKICSSNWIIPPGRDEHKTTTQTNTNTHQPKRLNKDRLSTLDSFLLTYKRCTSST